MSDFDLENSFKDDFENHPFEAPTKDKWSRLDAALDERDARRKRRRLVAAWLPILFGAAMVGFVCWQWHHSAQRAERLEQRVAQLEAAVVQCQHREKTGSFVEEQQASGNAAGFQDPIQNGLANRKPNFYPQLPTGSRFMLKNTDAEVFNAETHAPASIGDFDKNMPVTHLGVTTSHVLEPVETADSQANQFAATLSEKLAKRPIPALLPKAQHGFQMAYRTLSDNDLKIIPARKINKAARTRRWAVGIGAGQLFASQPGIPNFRGPTGSLTLQFAIHEKWRLTAATEANDLSFSTTKSDIPEIPAPPSPDDEFLRLEGAIQEESYALGVRRYFRPTKQVQPYISAEWVGINRISTKRDYLFSPANSPSSTLKISDEDVTPHFNGNNLRLGGGVSWKILRWLEWNAQASILNEQFKKDTRVDIGISTRFLFLF